jgi:GTP-binding protein
VLTRALRLGLRPIVIVNKVDRPQAAPEQALDKTFDLFVELGATDAQCDFPVLYGSGLNGWLVRDLENEAHEGMKALFETIIEYVPAPKGDPEAPFLMQVTTLGWNDHIGRTGQGRVLQGRVKRGQTIQRVSTAWAHPDRHALNVPPVRGDHWDVVNRVQEKVGYLWVTRGLDHTEVEEISAGDIVTLGGCREVNIGDTFCDLSLTDAALPPLEIEEPTVSMLFMVNSGPLAGQDGNAVTIRQIRARLDKELRTNVALRVEDVNRSDAVKVSGRGELHLGVLIEEMRREGMELCVSPPEIITRRDENGQLLEPMEDVTIDVPLEYQGTVIEKLARRKGELMHMHNEGHGLIRLEFRTPTRGLIGYRNEFLTDTRGLGVMASRFSGYGPWVGEVTSRQRGSMVSMENGEATAYSLDNLQERGTLFIGPMEAVYEGMIIGEYSRPGDLPCKPTKRKALTNHRASGRDQSAVLDVPRRLGLDLAMEWIAPDELVEVTPQFIRTRKATLRAEDRKRTEKQIASANS